MYSKRLAPLKWHISRFRDKCPSNCSLLTRMYKPTKNTSATYNMHRIISCNFGLRYKKFKTKPQTIKKKERVKRADSDLYGQDPQLELEPRSVETSPETEATHEQWRRPWRKFQRLWRRWLNTLINYQPPQI